MTEPKFTPGPWKAHHGVCEPDYVFYGEEENCDTEKRVIAEVYRRVGFRSYDVDLIAAAPEMYEMLASIRTTLKYMGYLPYLVKDIDLILRKARGESEVSE